MTKKIFLSHNLHGISTALLTMCVFMLLFTGINKEALIYGLLVGLLNLGLSYAFLTLSKRCVARHAGQSLSAMMKALVIRFFTVGVLLMLGFQWLAYAESMMVGFILGQLFYFFNQLIRIVKHVK